MDHETYRQRCLELSERHESGDWAGAAAGWRELLDRPGIPEIDRIGYFALEEAMRKILAYQQPFIRELIERIGTTRQEIQNPRN